MRRQRGQTVGKMSLGKERNNHNVVSSKRKD